MTWVVRAYAPDRQYYYGSHLQVEHGGRRSDRSV